MIAGIKEDLIFDWNNVFVEQLFPDFEAKTCVNFFAKQRKA